MNRQESRGRRQAALVRAQAPNPYRAQNPVAVSANPPLMWGKISGRQPAHGTVDVTLDHGSILVGVPLATQMLGSAAGSTYLPETVPVAPIDTPNGPYGLPTSPDPVGQPQVLALVGWVFGSGRTPVVLGIMPSPQSGIAPSTAGWAVQRHESGQWSATDPAGNTTMGWPDGTTISVTATGTPTNPTTAINPQWPPASGPDRQILIRLAGGASLTMIGDTIALNGGTAGVARVGDPVQVSGTDSAGNTFTATGTITSGSTTVLSG